MYDPSELVHDTPLRRAALRGDHLMAKRATRPRPALAPPPVPGLVLTTVAGVFLGSWLI